MIYACVPSLESTKLKIHNFAHTICSLNAFRFRFFLFFLHFFDSLRSQWARYFFHIFRFRMISLINWNILTFQFFLHWQHTRQNVYTGPMTFSIEHTSSSRLWHTKRDETWGAKRKRKKEKTKLTPTINKTAKKIAFHDKGNNNMKTTTKISFWFS